MKLPEHFERIRDERADKHLTSMNEKYSEIEKANMPTILSEEAYAAGFDACYAHMMPLLEEAIVALELALSFAPKAPVPQKLAPMFYHTLSYNGDVELQVKINGARELLTTLKQKLGKESQP